MRPSLSDCFVTLEHLRAGFPGSEGTRAYRLNERERHALERILRIARLATAHADEHAPDPARSQ